MFQKTPPTRLQTPSERNPREASKQICVGIVSAHLLAARYLLEVLKANPNMLPVIMFEGVNSAKVFPARSPIVILIDLWGLPLPTSEYLDTFAGALPGCAFLAVDRDRKETDVAHFLRTGFAGFITHAEVSHLLGPAIHAVAKDRIWISHEVIRIYLQLTSQRTTMRRAGSDTLTVRENQVLDLLRRRCSNKEVADLLGISESTVKFHVSNVLMKLNVNNRWELTEPESFFGARSQIFGKPAKKSSSYDRSETAAPRPVSQSA
jgi:two-component system, NarL family, response regulator LiaR